VAYSGEMRRSGADPGIRKAPEKMVMLPAHARKRRLEVEDRLWRLREFAETFPENRVGWGDTRRGFITSGVSYLYVKEAFPHASVLKLGMVYPFPEKLIRSFAEKVEELIVLVEKKSLERFEGKATRVVDKRNP
jgi:indolepyruvate ferredoxin oxidoreductase alpha subunit